MNANFATYKKILEHRVIDTRSELEEAQRTLKNKQAAYDVAINDKTAFENGMDELMSQCK